MDEQYLKQHTYYVSKLLVELDQCAIFNDKNAKLFHAELLVDLYLLFSIWIGERQDPEGKETTGEFYGYAAFWYWSSLDISLEIVFSL